jgi:Fe2+ or Zn2+ uptake regulation protein
MKKKLEDIVHDAGLKATPIRIAILDLIGKTNKPLSAKEIAFIFEKNNQKFDLVTIHRTLGTFSDTGLIQPVHISKDSTSYEIASAHRHHIVCIKCNDVEVFDDCSFEVMKNPILKHSKKFKEITRHSLELFGMCRKCIKG